MQHVIQASTGTDSYKINHYDQYGPLLEFLQSNWTARGSRVDGVESVLLFGLQPFFKRVLGEMWGGFFDMPEDEAVARYSKRISGRFGPVDVNVEHVRALHQLGYLPLRFRALPEGTEVPLRIPMFVVENTHKKFAWVVNYLESIMSTEIWMPMTTATLALRMRRMLDEFAGETSDMPEFVNWQGHDFSFRGMASMEAGAASGSGHLLSFAGSDTIPAVDWIETYYPLPAGREFLVAASVPATEHSVMMIGGPVGEKETFEHVLGLYPSGIVSIVSDTWDLFGVIRKILPQLKDMIMKRDGRLVVRPDSGDPVKIVCGDPDAVEGSDEHKGVIELLWEEFGGVVNSKGYKQVDLHVGCIYGDGITYERALAIVNGLKKKGFASTNVVFGIGSFSYQHQTRDTFGFAMKATWAQVAGESRDLYKDPKTDNGLKKSARGRLAVVRNEAGELELIQGATPEQEAADEFVTVWENGKLLVEYSFADVVERVGVRTIFEL